MKFRDVPYRCKEVLWVCGFAIMMVVAVVRWARAAATCHVRGCVVDVDGPPGKCRRCGWRP
jgi:hypothetical protein